MVSRTEPFYVSVHIPKTAGTTFGAALRIAFGGAVRYDYGSQFAFTDPVPPSFAVQFHRAIARRRARLRRRHRSRAHDRCVHGHFQATRYLHMLPEARLVTWLRDPVERVISHYEFWRRRPPLTHSVGRMMRERELSLLEFAALPAMRDLQSRYLDGVALEQFWFIGIQEQFEPLLAVFLQRVSGSAAPVSARNVNPARAAGRQPRVDPDVREQIARLNLQDRRAWHAARDLIERRGPLAD